MPKSARGRSITPWGWEVKRRLARRGLLQDDLVRHLCEIGLPNSKTNMSRMLYGRGLETRQAEIAAINELLGIKMKAAG